MQMDRPCSIVEQYLAYLITIKGRSKNTVIEYRLDLLQFFKYVADTRGKCIQISVLSTSTISVQLVSVTCMDFLLIARILCILLPAQEHEKLFPSGNSGSISKPKCI